MKFGTHDGSQGIIFVHAKVAVWCNDSTLWHCISFSALAAFSRNALCKSTFYLLTFFTYLLFQISEVTLRRAWRVMGWATCLSMLPATQINSAWPYLWCRRNDTSVILEDHIGHNSGISTYGLNDHHINPGLHHIGHVSQTIAVSPPTGSMITPSTQDCITLATCHRQ